MWSLGLSLALLSCVVLAAAQSSQYTLVQSHQGASFFDNWGFYEGLDVNNTGLIFYVSQETALDQKLIFANDVGNTIIRVDNFTDGTGNSSFLRNTVKILSDYTVYMGDLVMMDAVHMPFGCSVWPAFWTVGPNWPDNGEIDIVENVNLATNNRFSMHTLDGCTHPPNSTVSPTGQSGGLSTAESGILLSTDCFNLTNHDQGCLVEVPSTASYGADFAAAGGGAYALLWDIDGIRMWFFERKDVPADFASDTPQPSGWVTPTAFYPASTCNFTQFFTPQTLIFETTVCGGFSLSKYSLTCPGDCLSLVPIPSNYDDAYWELSFVKVFRQADSTFTDDSLPTSTTEVSQMEPSGGSMQSNQQTNASTLIKVSWHELLFHLLLLSMTLA